MSSLRILSVTSAAVKFRSRRTKHVAQIDAPEMRTRPTAHARLVRSQGSCCLVYQARRAQEHDFCNTAIEAGHHRRVPVESLPQ